MEYTTACKIFNAVFGGIMKKEFTKRYGKEYAKIAAQRARQEYKAIITRTPDIGSDNPFLSTLFMGAAFVAWYLAVRDTMSVTEMEATVLTALENSSLVKLSAKRSDKTNEKYKKWLANAESWTKQNAERYPESWVITEEDAPVGSTAFTFSRCGLWELCKRENCPEFAPVLCKTDYVMARFGKANLARKSTLADGADRCDFLYTQKKVK
jgi:type I restriction enzyme S subunit